jgi:hypothetical protein
MTSTTFKVVEFYRNNNANSVLNSSILNSSMGSTDLDKTLSPTKTALGNQLVYNILGFNIVGGYSTEIPATIVDVARNTNGKPVKVLFLKF